MLDELTELTPEEQALMLAWDPTPCTPVVRSEADIETDELESDFFRYDAGI